MSEKPAWLSKLEAADRAGTTPQSHSGVTVESASRGSSGGGSGKVTSYTIKNGVAVPNYESSTTADSTNYEAELNRIANAKKQAAVNQLNAAKEKALNNLNQEKQNVEPYYTKQKQIATGNSNLSAKNLASYLAKRGLNSTGIQAQAEMARQNTLNTNINAINDAKTQQLANLDNQITNTKNDYESQVASVSNELEAQQAEKLLSYKLAEEQRLREEQKQRDELQWNQQLQTLGAYADNYQAEINRRTAINPDDPLIPYLKAARQQKIQQLDQVAKDDSLTQKEYAYKKLSILGQADEEVSRILGIPVGTKTADYQAQQNSYSINQQELNLRRASASAGNGSSPVKEGLSVADYAKINASYNNYLNSIKGTDAAMSPISFEDFAAQRYGVIINGTTAIDDDWVKKS